MTHSQWQVIEKPLDEPRKRKFSLRLIVNALFYIAHSGIECRMLPQVYPKWELVYYYFRKWSSTGVVSEIHDCLVKSILLSCGRCTSPSLGLIDSYSVKTHSKTVAKGYDANKKQMDENL